MINPDSGSQATESPDSAWQSVLALYDFYENVDFIGYVPTGYGDESLFEVANSQINGYFELWNNVSSEVTGETRVLKGITGIFFDEVNGIDQEKQAVLLEMYKGYSEEVKNSNENYTVVFNFGTNYMTDGSMFDENWLEPCDICILYENDLEEVSNPWDSYEVLPEAVGMSSDKFCSILRSAPFASETTKNVEQNNLISAGLIQQMWSKNFAWQYATPEIGDYNNFMPYQIWNSFVSSANQFSFSCEPSEFNYGNTCMSYSETGEICEIDAQCSDSGKCLGKCCNQWNTDENCGVCGETGWCDSCVLGFAVQVSELNSTLSLCVELSQVDVGEMCFSDGQCTVSGVCKENCCNQWMDDVNCEVCGDAGWCESCKSGFEWEGSTGCVAITEEFTAETPTTEALTTEAVTTEALTTGGFSKFRILGKTRSFEVFFGSKT